MEIDNLKQTVETEYLTIHNYYAQTKTHLTVATVKVLKDGTFTCHLNFYCNFNSVQNSIIERSNALNKCYEHSDGKVFEYINLVHQRHVKIALLKDTILRNML